MKKTLLTIKSIAIGAACAYLLMIPPVAHACSRVLYEGGDNLVITGRTQDWYEEQQTDLWVFPRGMQRNGEVGPKSVKWTSKYGSLVASVYNIATGEGVNEKGLAVYLLYLNEADYGKSTNKKRISVGAWGQYILDNFATVAEAVKELSKDKLQIIAPELPNGHAATIHVALSDASGDSAILEHVKGKLVIHHDRQYKVMTNSPSYDEQLALNTYWKEIGGAIMLPGTNRPADRFVRASYYIDAMPEISDPREAVASVMSVMRNVSVPRGYKDPVKPNIAATIWRSVFDHKNRVYYYEPTSSPSVFWVSMKKLDFKKGAPVMKLELEDGKRILSGDAADKFIKAKPFKFITDQK